MRAAALVDYDVFDVIDVPTPRIMGATEVVVRVAGAGVCGSDVHMAQGRLRDVMGDLSFPVVMGHENGGHVSAVGDAVRSLSAGDPVLLHPHISCGLCRACRRGNETFCESLRFPGVDGTPGGYAEYVKTDVRAVVKLPAGVDPAPLSAITDAGLTAYRAVRKVVDRLAPDGTAVVLGVGGVGSFALQILRLFSPARIIAVDAETDRQALAADLGADGFVRAGDGASDEISSLTRGAGVDLVMDCVGLPGTPQFALEILGRGGVLCAVGSGGGDICCETMGVTFRELCIEGSLVGTLGELTEVVGLALRDRIQLRHTFYPLEQAGQALADLRAGRVDGRAILQPSS